MDPVTVPLPMLMIFAAVSEPLSAVRFRSACRAHASCVNECLGPMINLPAVASSIFVNVKPLVLRSGNRRRRQTDFVFYPPRVIGELEFRRIQVGELPQHRDDVGLS